jgi:regulator of protease activity HflC (stomatin/prohibitin superfamily)
MTNYISGLVFVVLALIGAAIALAIGLVSPVVAIVLAAVWFAAAVVASSSIKLAAQWEQALVFRVGKYHGIRGPGLFLDVMDAVKSFARSRHRRNGRIAQDPAASI